MNKKQRKRYAGKAASRALKTRDKLWPDLDKRRLWIRTQKDGFTTIPRTMPIILRIMDDMSNRRPVASTYLALWSRVFDECMVTIPNPRELAFEAGFSGQRSEQTWSTRMQILLSLSFIDAKPGPSGPFNYVLLWNPYEVIDVHHKKKKVQEAKYIALYTRAQEVGADDLDE